MKRNRRGALFEFDNNRDQRARFAKITWNLTISEFFSARERETRGSDNYWPARECSASIDATQSHISVRIYTLKCVGS